MVQSKNAYRYGATFARKSAARVFSTVASTVYCFAISIYLLAYLHLFATIQSLTVKSRRAHIYLYTCTPITVYYINEKINEIM